MQQNSGSRNTIAEVVYAASSGVWTYFHFRDDKVSPNHISTVMSVFMEQAEAIGVDELEYRLLARNEAENDFTAQLVSMRSKALYAGPRAVRTPWRTQKIVYLYLDSLV